MAYPLTLVPCSFYKKERGSVVLAMLIVLPVILLLAGVTLTISNSLASQSQLGNASEAAAMYLAKRELLNSAQASNADASHFIRQFSQTNDLNKVTLNKENSGYRVKASASMPYLLLAPSDGKVPVSNQGAAGIASSKSKVDIILMLDLSSSQSLSIAGTIGDLNRMISTIERRYEPGTIRLGLMPFSFLPSIDDALWLPESATRLQCITATSVKSGLFGSIREDIKGTVNDLFLPPSQIQMAKPVARPLDTTWLTEKCPDIGALALTTKLDKVRARINQHKEKSNGGITIYHHALIMSARMLAKSWSGDWDSSSEFEAESEKVIIAIGDGADGGSYAFDFKKLIDLGLCDEIRDENIKLYQLQYGSQVRANSNIERCVGSKNAKPAAEIDELMDIILKDTNRNNNILDNTLRLIK